MSPTEFWSTLPFGRRLAALGLPELRPPSLGPDLWAMRLSLQLPSVAAELEHCRGAADGIPPEPLGYQQDVAKCHEMEGCWWLGMAEWLGILYKPKEMKD